MLQSYIWVQTYDILLGQIHFGCCIELLTSRDYREFLGCINLIYWFTQFSPFVFSVFCFGVLRLVSKEGHFISEPVWKPFLLHGMHPLVGTNILERNAEVLGLGNQYLDLILFLKGNIHIQYSVLALSGIHRLAECLEYSAGPDLSLWWPWFLHISCQALVDMNLCVSMN